MTVHNVRLLLDQWSRDVPLAASELAHCARGPSHLQVLLARLIRGGQIVKASDNRLRYTLPDA